MTTFGIANVSKDLPVFSTTLEYENLKTLIADHKRVYPQRYRSNVQAWRSDWFTHKKDPRFQEFVDVCTQACNFLSANHFQAECSLVCSNMWIVDYEKGDWTKDHDHFPDVMSCVYFVEVEEDCAPIIFEDQLKIQPKNNLLIFFPSLLRHKVPPTDSKRIVISMNFRLASAIPNIEYTNGLGGIN